MYEVKERLKQQQEKELAQQILKESQCERKFSQVVDYWIKSDVHFFNFYKNRSSQIYIGRTFFDLDCPAMSRTEKLDTGEKIQFDLIPPHSTFFSTDCNYNVNVNIKQ